MPNLNGNWIDLIIILVLIFFASEAWRVGFWVIMADFLSFLGSLLISLRAYKFTAEVLKANFALTGPVANALGFLITALIFEYILGFIFGRLLGKLPEKFWKHRLNKFLGIIPALGEALVLISFVLTLILALPIRPQIKADVGESRIGGFLLKQTSGIEARVNEIFGGVINDSLTYLTIKPGSKESIPLQIEVRQLTVDEEAEGAMFALVNEERRKAGVKELSWAPNIVPVARAHAKDMWERKYFGHFSPEGDDAGDRLSAAGIKYSVAGENLALAPTVNTAHIGLMNSEGHRANILEKNFRRVGIGVIDNGIYGKMFVQVFTD